MPTLAQASAPDVVAELRRIADVLASLDRRLANVEANARLIQGTVDAWRQAEGRPSFPQPPGWVSRSR